jgi:uncharacterized membrane protein YeaQ/YmgE (transglycosylase-associated protein family)
MNMRNNNTIAVIAIVGAVIVAWLVLNTAGDAIGFVIRLLLWMLAGTLAGRLLRGRGYGLLGDVLLGLVGGIVGSIVFGLIGLGGFSASLIGGVIAGVVGAVILVYLVRLVSNANFAR